jgi:hypothetical protein
MKPLITILATVILAACTTSTALPPTPQTATPTLSSDLPPDEVFVNEIYHRLSVDDTISDAGRQATISLFMGRSTALFPDNQGLVLVFEVPTVPKNQEETTRAAVMLVGTAVSVATDMGVALSGVEVIFYTNSTPFIGFRATPPWGLKNIEAAPLAEELRQRIEENVGTVTPEPKPTMPLSGG